MKQLIFIFFTIILSTSVVSCGGDEDEPNGISYSLTSNSEDVSISQNGRDAISTTRGRQTYEIAISGDFSNVVFDSYIPWAEASHHSNIITVNVTRPNDGEAESGYINFTVFNDSKSASGKINISYKETTYDDLLDEERAAINFFLKGQDVATTTPSNISQFQVGNAAPFYWLDDAHNVAMRIVSMGNDGMPQNGDKVYFRFGRCNLMEYYKTGVMPPFSGNTTDGSSAWFILNDFTYNASAQWGKGLQMPLLAGLPYGSEVQLVVASSLGLPAEVSSVIPMFYNIRYYLAEAFSEDKFPDTNVYVAFNTQAEWSTFGVISPCSWKFFDRTNNKPTNFPYTGEMATGLGGLFLIQDFFGNPFAIDAACPVERDQSIRIWLDAETGIANCQSCGSKFNLFEHHGLPISGPATEKGFALKEYNVDFFGYPYAIIRN